MTLPPLPDDLTKYIAAAAEIDALRKGLPPGSSAPRIDAMTREEMDAKLEAAEARTDTKFAELLGEMKLLRAEMTTTSAEVRSAKTTYLITAIASVLAIGGLIVGMLSFGGDQFGRGMDVQAVIDATVKASRAPPTP